MKFPSPFRIVLWLLLLALPAHAVAATSMGYCVRMNRVAVSNTVAPQQIEKAEQTMASDDAMPDCHGAMVKKLSASEDAGGDGKLTKLPTANGKCSACDSCCYAVAAVGGIVAQTFALPNQTTQFNFVSSAITFITGGLERPPKHLYL